MSIRGWAMVAAASTVAGVMLVLAQPVVAGALVAGALLLWWLTILDWWRRAYVLVLVTSIAGVSTIDPLVDIARTGRFVAVAILVVVTWALTWKLPANPTRAGKLFVIGLYVFLAVAIVSIGWSVVPAESALQCIALAMLVVILHLLVTRRWVTRATLVADLSTGYLVMVAAFLASLGAVLIGFPTAYGFTGRLQGIFNNPNMLALLAAVVIPVGFGLFRESPSVWRALSLAPPVLALVMSGSRTAMLAAGAAVLWIWLRSSWRVKLWTAIAGAPLVIIPVAAGWNPFGDLFGRFGSTEGGDVLNGRGGAWSLAFELFQERPIGYGWQATPALFESMFGAEGFSFTRVSAHNSYIQILIELGIIGALILGAILILVVVVAVKVPKEGLGLGLSGAIVAGLVVQMGESAMFGTGQPYPYLFWFAVAGAASIMAVSPKRVEVPQRQLVRHSPTQLAA